MVKLVVPNEAEINLLKYIVNAETPGDAVLRLYENNLTLSPSTVIGDFTEVVANGYSPITLAHDQWTFSSVDDISSASYAPQTFTISGAQEVYGYYVTNTGGTKLLWAQASDCMVNFSTGGVVVVTPRFGAGNL